MEKTVTTTIRIPESLLTAIKHSAVNNRRSFNSEVITILEKNQDNKEKEHDAVAA